MADNLTPDEKARLEELEKADAARKARVRKTNLKHKENRAEYQKKMIKEKKIKQINLRLKRSHTKQFDDYMESNNIKGSDADFIRQLLYDKGVIYDED